MCERTLYVGDIDISCSRRTEINAFLFGSINKSNELTKVEQTLKKKKKKSEKIYMI